MKSPFLALLSLCSLLSLGCEKKEELPVPQAPDPNKPAGSAGLANAPTEYLSQAGKAAQSMEKTVDTAAINKALQLFAVEEGRIPESLDELVQKNYLGKLPTPPHGTKLHYDKSEGKVSVVKQ